MARPNARIEERVAARCDAIAVSLDRERDIVAAERELMLARRDMRHAEQRVAAAERAVHTICIRDRQLILELRQQNRLDCAA